MTGDLRPITDPFALLAEDALSPEEEHYIGAARAANTIRGYRSDWSEFTAWCGSQGRPALSHVRDVGGGKRRSRGGV